MTKQYERTEGFFSVPDYSLDVLIGKTCTHVDRVENEDGNDGIVFELDNGDIYMLAHKQDCCEDVVIESIVGELSDLIGTPIWIAESVSNESWDDRNVLHHTWTFYKFATHKGYVDIRFHGDSNGYYSESVDFYKVKVKE